MSEPSTFQDAVEFVFACKPFYEISYSRKQYGLQEKLDVLSKVASSDFSFSKPLIKEIETEAQRVNSELSSVDVEASVYTRMKKNLDKTVLEFSSNPLLAKIRSRETTFLAESYKAIDQYLISENVSLLFTGLMNVKNYFIGQRKNDVSSVFSLEFFDPYYPSMTLDRGYVPSRSILGFNKISREKTDKLNKLLVDAFSLDKKFKEYDLFLQ